MPSTVRDETRGQQRLPVFMQQTSWGLRVPGPSLGTGEPAIKKRGTHLLSPPAFRGSHSGGMISKLNTSLVSAGKTMESQLMGNCGQCLCEVLHCEGMETGLGGQPSSDVGEPLD